MTRIALSFLALFAISFSLAANTQKQPGENIQKDNYYPMVKFETSLGDLVIELNRKRAPVTVNNFLN